jgi:hypothetical protein
MMKKRIIYLMVLVLLVVEACTPQSPTATVTLTPSTITTQTPTSILPIETRSPDQTKIFETSSPQLVTPTITPTLSAIIEITPGTGEDDEAVSPAYDVYIGRNYVGVPCGWDTNAGGFLRLAWVSIFYNVRFSIPPVGWPSDEPFPGDIYSGDDESITELADYAYCPQYEGDEVLECSVYEGPKPFKAIIYVDTPEQEEFDFVPVSLVETPDPLDDGPVMGLHYYLWDIGEVINAGTDLGKCDGMGSSCGWPAPQTFPISWQRVVLGDEFIKEFGYQYDDGSTDTYTVHFIPVISK